jgi:glucose-6-phosphate 1-dehydrogenase
MDPDQLVVKLDPTTGLRIQLAARRTDLDLGEQIRLDVEFGQQGGQEATPYEVLLDAAMRGQTTRFTRQDGVEEQWRIVQPLLESPPPVQPYAPGTWGPDSANALVAAHGRWYGPWIGD